MTEVNESKPDGLDDVVLSEAGSELPATPESPAPKSVEIEGGQDDLSDPTLIPGQSPAVAAVEEVLVEEALVEEALIEGGPVDEDARLAEWLIAPSSQADPADVVTEIAVAVGDAGVVDVEIETVPGSGEAVLSVLATIPEAAEVAQDDAGQDDAGQGDTDVGDTDAGDEIELDDADVVVPALHPFDLPGRWYVVHSYAGYENRVKSNLETRVRSMNVDDRIFEVLIPTEDVVEFKQGKKTVSKKKVFPGYVLVRMSLDDDTWYVVRNTPGITGFVGSGAKPTPLTKREVENILGTGDEALADADAGHKRARPKVDFEIGETVRMTSGPFAEFNGSISEIDVDRSKLKVFVNIFGRETPVELDFSEVSKL